MIIPTLILGAALINPATEIKWKPQYADNPNASWFAAQKDCGGASCCGRSDAEPYYEGYEQHANGSVTLGDGTKIQSCQVLPGPNPTGHALWWHMDRTTYCFSPGPGL